MEVNMYTKILRKAVKKIKSMKSGHCTCGHCS